jgi:hypothetical protein
VFHFRVTVSSRIRRLSPRHSVQFHREKTISAAVLRRCPSLP